MVGLILQQLLTNRTNVMFGRPVTFCSLDMADKKDHPRKPEWPQTTSFSHRKLPETCNDHIMMLLWFELELAIWK